jgi:hypothetical protein
MTVRCRQALHEAVPVLRVGGRLRIVDPRADRYDEALRDAGCVDITVRRLDWRTWYGIPGHAGHSHYLGHGR